MCLKKNKQDVVRLEKQKTLKEKVVDFKNKYYWYLVIIGVCIALFLFVYLCFSFVPGTESGTVYNNRTGVI